MNSLILVIISFIGLVLGSFASAVSYRVPMGKSFLTGRSICPNCKKKISWYDNIPLVSYLFLLGKCRNCGKAISLRYPLIELSSAIGLSGVYILNAKGVPNILNNTFGEYSVFVTIIVFYITFLIFITDWETFIIPDSVVFFGFTVFSLIFLVFDAPSLYQNFFAAFAAAAFLLLIHLITRGRGMGLGDVKFALFAGIVLGPTMSVVWLFMAFFIGAIVGLFLIIIRRARLGSEIPFGPFLSLSLIATLYLGETILRLLNFA